MRTIILLALIFAARDAGAAGAFDFVTLDGSARSTALGGSYTGLAADAQALNVNPGGLGALRGHEALFMHEERFAGVTRERIAAAFRQGFGIEFQRLDFGKVERTSYASPTGGGGSAGHDAFSLSAGYGRRLVPALAVGGAVKFMRASIDSASANAQAVDVGLLGWIPAVRGATYGFAIQNIGSASKFDAASEPLPLVIRAGGAYQFEARGVPLLAALDLTKKRDESAAAHLGFEARPIEAFSARLGYDSGNDAGIGLTIGLGLNRGPMSFDYAFVPYGDLGVSHRLSLSYRWGAEPEKSSKPEKDVYYLR